ncbi:hypothetical protein BAUCODRAFT_31277 [Baudoinia panamericana UAMH 10762]|uniref:Uncharacterized protein n=1 Tax=Baudoinia panamericana (strain UAMH 10762) TaxID=717646 RepID=M2LWI1_BAUPA|nr:uncharacterized protein BAUCODRAFT_31277 [Baudoinia panamericana UAMH 10762]EMC99002.1 hypothetical protein BAUCODRAFT_31277 [Baudoinia panamericana UAMH 10762]
MLMAKDAVQTLPHPFHLACIYCDPHNLCELFEKHLYDQRVLPLAYFSPFMRPVCQCGPRKTGKVHSA